MAKKKQTFETAMQRLEEIIRLLEEEEVTLEKSVALYQEGLELSAYCKETLARAEGEILIMEKNADTDTFTEQKFGAEEVEV